MNLAHPSHFAAALRGLSPHSTDPATKRHQRAIVTALDGYRRLVSRYDGQRVSEAEWICVKDKQK